MFCLSRCADLECICNIVRSAASGGRNQIFEQLNAHDPPLPAEFQKGPVSGEKHYKHYADLRGKATTEDNLPSRNLSRSDDWWQEKKDADDEKKKSIQQCSTSAQAK